MIHRNIKKPLNLVGMQINGDQSIDAGLSLLTGWL